MEPSNTREKILRAALELAAERGLRGTSLGDIAARVGIRKPSLYNHFSSREDLVRAMYAALRDLAERAHPKPGTGVLRDAVRDLGAVGTVQMVLRRQGKIRGEAELDRFLNIVESEKYFDPTAAEICRQEARWMEEHTRILLEALRESGALDIRDMDTAVFLFAGAARDLFLSRTLFSEEDFEEKAERLARGFCGLYGGEGTRE